MRIMARWMRISWVVSSVMVCIRVPRVVVRRMGGCRYVVGVPSKSVAMHFVCCVVNRVSIVRTFSTWWDWTMWICWVMIPIMGRC